MCAQFWFCKQTWSFKAGSEKALAVVFALCFSFFLCLFCQLKRITALLLLQSISNLHIYIYTQYMLKHGTKNLLRHLLHHCFVLCWHFFLFDRKSGDFFFLLVHFLWILYPSFCQKYLLLIALSKLETYFSHKIDLLPQKGEQADLLPSWSLQSHSLTIKSYCSPAIASGTLLPCKSAIKYSIIKS